MKLLLFRNELLLLIVFGRPVFAVFVFKAACEIFVVRGFDYFQTGSTTRFAETGLFLMAEIIDVSFRSCSGERTTVVGAIEASARNKSHTASAAGSGRDRE